MKIKFQCGACGRVEEIEIYALASKGFELECPCCKARFKFVGQAVEQTRAADACNCPETLHSYAVNSSSICLDCGNPRR
jgi:hypothetical protein